MASAVTASSIDVSVREPSLVPVIVISAIVHLVVLVGIPLLAKLTYRSEKYSRPTTFQLVSPSILKASMPKRATAVNKPKSAETTPVPKKQKTASEPKKQEENTNDLSELLDAVPTIKVSEIASSQNFKYHWYLQNVVSKVEEQWKPPLGLTEKKDAAVIVSFTILQNGNISDVSVATSSSVSTLDNLAMRAIQLAAPFGKLPIGFTDDRLDITYTLHYVK